MRVLWFIALKVVEISAAVFGPYYLGRLIHLWTGFFCMHDAAIPECLPFWLIGLMGAIFALFGVGLACVAFGLLLANWNLADILHRKFKK